MKPASALPFVWALVLSLLLTAGTTTLHAAQPTDNQAASVSADGIKFFEGTWDQVLAEAKKTGKPIFVDFYATWCGPCKTMASKTFTNKSVGDYANPRFIAYKVDCEKGEGVSLANKYAIEAYPTIIFFNADGTVKQKSVGYKDTEQFLMLLKKNTPANLLVVGEAQPIVNPELSAIPNNQVKIADGIKFFEGTWAELLAEAKKTGKPFFVDFYTTWCGPCKMMSSGTFKDVKVGEYTSQNYLAYKVDCEKGEGISLAKQYKITAYPTILFYNANGEMVKKEMGYMPAETFLEVLKVNLPKK